MFKFKQFKFGSRIQIIQKRKRLFLIIIQSQMNSNIVPNNQNRQPNYGLMAIQQQRGAQQKPMYIQKGQNASNNYSTQQSGENRPLQYPQARNQASNLNQMFFASHNPMTGGISINAGQSTGQFGAGQMSSMVNPSGKGSLIQNTLLGNKNSEATGLSVEASYEQQQYELRQRLLMQNNITGQQNNKGLQQNSSNGRHQAQPRSQTGSQGPPLNRQPQPVSYQSLSKQKGVKNNSNISRQQANTVRQISQNAKQKGMDGLQPGANSKYQNSKSLRAHIPTNQQTSLRNAPGNRGQVSRERAALDYDHGQFKTLPQNSVHGGQLASQVLQQNANYQTVQLVASDSRDNLERLREIQRYSPEHQGVLLKKQQSAGAHDFKSTEQVQLNFSAAQSHIPGTHSSQSLGGNAGSTEYDLPRQILEGKLLNPNEQAQGGSQLPFAPSQEVVQMQQLLEQQRLQNLLQNQVPTSKLGIQANFIDFYNQFQAQQVYSPQEQTPLANQLDKYGRDQQSPGSDESDEALQRMILGLKQDVNECKLLFEKRANANQEGSGSSPRGQRTQSMDPLGAQEPTLKASSSKRQKSHETQSSGNTGPRGRRAEEVAQQLLLVERQSKSSKSSKAAYSGTKASPQYSQPLGKGKPIPGVQMNIQSEDLGHEKYRVRQSLPSASEQAVDGALNAELNLNSQIPQEEFGPQHPNLNIQERANGEESEESKENQRIFQFSPLSSKKEPFDGESSKSGSERGPSSSNEHPPGEDTGLNEAPSAPHAALSSANLQDGLEELARNRSNEAVEERKMRLEGPQAQQIPTATESTGKFKNFQNESNLSEQPSNDKSEALLSQNARHKPPMTIQQHSRISGQPLQTELYSQQDINITQERETESRPVQQITSQGVSPMNLLVQPQVSGANISAFDQLNETTLQQNIQPEKVKVVYMEKKVEQTDQNVQTISLLLENKPVQATFSRLVQTEEEKKPEREVRNLSPFETYDLLFIRDLVNNLNYDNEVLNDNSADLKTAFMFLFNEHKQLQFQYQKERRNQKLIALYRKRLEEVGKEKDDAIMIGMKLKTKIEMMTDIMRITVEESQAQQKEQDVMIDDLMEENKHLRSLMGIHRENQDDKAIEQGLEEQAVIEKMLESKPKDDSIESEIHNQLLSYEQELVRDQEDFLISLREEHEHQFKQELTKQDAQFSREIDEHKEAIERIYDEKLQERSEEIEQELRETLTEDITTDLTVTLTEQLTESITKEVDAKVKAQMAQTKEKQQKEEVSQETKNDVKSEILAQLQDEIQSGKSSELLQQITALVEAQMQSTNSTQKDNLEKMQALRLMNQKSSESENNKTQDLQALMKEQPQYDKDITEDNYQTKDIYDDIEEKHDLLDMLNYQEQDRKATRDQFKQSSKEKQTPKQLQLNDNEEFVSEDQSRSAAHSKFMSEKSKFKQELMMSNTIPYGKKKQSSSQHFDDLNNASPTNFKTMKEKEILSVPRSQKSKNLTGSSGQSASDNYSDDNLPGNQFDYQQIFENQDMSKEEEELMNQLKAQEEHKDEKEDDRQKQDELENYGQQNSGSNNSYDEEDSDYQGSPEREGPLQQIIRTQDHQDQDFQRDPNWNANQINQDDNQVNPDEQLTPRRNRETRNHNQFQGFQGQTIRQVQQQQQREQTEAESNYSQTQGLQRGSQGSGSSPDQVQDRDQIMSQGDGAEPTQPGRQISIQSFFGSNERLPNVSERSEPASSNSSQQRRRGQGFQGQELSGVSRTQGLFETPELGGIEPIRSDDQINEIDDEYDDFFQGIQQEMQGDGQISQQSPAGSSLIEPNTQDTFGDQLGQEINQASGPENTLERNLEKFLEDEDEDDFNDYEKEMADIDNPLIQRQNTPWPEGKEAKNVNSEVKDKGENLLDSTKGMSKMAKMIEQEQNQLDDHDADHLAEERDADKEEVYDYFLDAHKDENANENKGYHIIDAADLGESEGGMKKLEEADSDDLDQIQDDELRDYRYKNMLEDLKDKIQEEEEEKQIIKDKRGSK